MTRLHLVKPLLTASFGVLVTASALAASAAPVTGWVWPLDPVPHVVRPFQPPESPYGPGHRGVDLAGTVGQPVLAIGRGTVTFAGSVADRGVVVVDHGPLSSTYQPVTAYVSLGARVAAGQTIGSLQLVDSHCAPDACLHLGVTRGDSYLDPLSLLPARAVRLKPLGGLGQETEPGGLLPPPPRAGRSQGRGSRALSGAADGAMTGLAAGGRGPPVSAR